MAYYDPVKSVFEVKGVSELAAQLNVLNDDIRKRVANAAVFAGAKIIKDLAVREISRQITGAEDAARGDDPYLRYLRDNIISPRGRGSGRGDRFWYVVTIRHKGKGLKLKPKVSKIRGPRVKLAYNKRKKTARIVQLTRTRETNPYQIGIHNEFGTVRARPQPFMRPAFEKGKQSALDATLARLRDRIARANRAVR